MGLGVGIRLTGKGVIDAGGFGAGEGSEIPQADKKNDPINVIINMRIIYYSCK